MSTQRTQTATCNREDAPRLKSDLNSMPILLQLWIHRARAFDSKFAYILPCIIVKGVAPQCFWRGAYRDSVFCRAVRRRLLIQLYQESWRLRLLFQIAQPSTSGVSMRAAGEGLSGGGVSPGMQTLYSRLLALPQVSWIALYYAKTAFREARLIGGCNAVVWGLWGCFLC